MLAISEIEDMGEESGREEAADHFPFLPRPSTLSDEDYKHMRRGMTRRGRARAQGLYELRGRAAHKFAWAWASGYMANCDLFEREGHYEEEQEGV